MRTLRNTFLLILFVSAFAFSACQKKDYSEFCAQADAYLTSSNFQGTVLVSRGNDIIFCKGFGPSDEKDKSKTPVLNDGTSVYEIGSITKQMTAACIMQLVENKKLLLTDTLDKFFPEYEHGPEITVEMLLNMRSGLLDHINAPDEFFGIKLARQIAKKEQAGKNVDRNQVLDALYKAPLLTKPNSTYFYSNTNYYLLALIIENITGRSYEDYMEENIFQKAGMTSANTIFQQTTTKGYLKNKYYSIPKNMAVGCGDVNASAEDLFKWNTAFVGNKIVSKKTFESMINTDSYGYGVYRSKDSILHSGSTIAFNSYNEYFLKDKTSIIVLTNKPQSLLNATLVGGKIKKLLYGEN